MNKFKITGFTLCTLALLGLGACGNDETATNNESRVALQVTSGIKTRAYGTQWQPNDAIGIFMLKAGSTDICEDADNRKYYTSDGNTSFFTTVEQTIYLPLDGSSVDFVAYYPYQQTLTNGSLALDVSSQTNLPAIDLLVASAKTTNVAPYDNNHPQVTLGFTHRLTKLELNIIAGSGLQTSDLKGLKVEISKQRTSGTYDPQFQTFGILSSPIQTVTMNTNSDGTTSQAILMPNSASDGINPVVAGRELIFTLAATGDVFRWSIPDSKLFEQGDRNIYNITLNRTGVEITATITDWNTVTGGNGSAGM